MIVAVADTHAVIWYIFDDPRLSNRARAFIAEAARDGNRIGVSSISLFEMVYLVEKRRIAVETFSRLATALDNPDNVMIEIASDLRIARTMSQIDGSQIPDMPDRIIAATALSFNVPLISRDGLIRASSFSTIW